MHAICIHPSHAGESRLGFPWRVLDNIQGPLLECPLSYQSPSRTIILEESKERGKRGDMDRGNH